mmetsp:Transcript_68096/g.154057  ORF Transcript_68096/g.154057 Transcript_68096/m.154057 type:complete len:146 (+) Transcript_68096:128-565(+)|eukprot:CAMPEP_0172583612 /NCGR_PEP_ID=MMETSP1068-20121228/3220_1 /TAXON_ID=35684 /ORGANISM="Pseudopedinella elastica, Strain CCMP716" /LENGTH=145 /DNA_ID=CAMNT_0013377475 /DNA_START=92 /DNA_END=529 /DNA_ORIENTATION=+
MMRLIFLAAFMLQGSESLALHSPRIRAVRSGLTSSMVGGVTIDKPGVKKGPTKQVAPPDNKSDTRGGGGAKFRVMLFNDPVNTKEYVARVLMTKAGLDEGQAFQCMMQAHRMGMGLIGIWLRERAEAITSMCTEGGLTVTMIPDE